MIDTKNEFAKLKNPFHKTNMRQKNSYIDPSIWNSLPDSIKKANSLNTSNILSKSTIWTSDLNNELCVLVRFPLTYSFWYIFFLFTIFSNFRSDLSDHNDSNAFRPFLYYSIHCLYYSYLSAVTL